jgi:protein-S-isoprenylcysteine O-methyltransferase Ste14
MSLKAILGLIIIACWLVFLVYWLISSLSASPYARRNNVQWGIRALIAVFVIVLLQFRGAARFLASGPPNPVLGAVGVALCVLGIAIAIWARIYLGRNWGMPMTLKQDPELVTTGPYSYVRHPIYTGMLLAMLGSALATNLLWLVILICLGAYFIYSALQEQKIMLKEFPDAYPAYMKRTKMLIPFVL